MWTTDHERLTLLELLCRGTLKRRASQAAAFVTLAGLPWTQATGRRDEVGIVEERRGDLLQLIERVWPGWRAALAELVAIGALPTPEGWRKLLDHRRSAELGSLPETINRRTAAALVAPHSKAMLSEERVAALGDVRLTHDGVIRLRPPPGLSAHSERGTLDLSAIAAVLGEVALPERALLDGLRLDGPIRAALLVENLGAWRDMPAPSGWLLVHVPGWDTTVVGHLLDQLAGVPVVHFSDLDANGFRIHQHLRAKRPDLIWFIPTFWEDDMERCALTKEWPPDLDLSAAPAIVRELARRGRWLEQERVALDSRLLAALDVLTLDAATDR